jgi:signal transduction histidine kinase
MRATSDLLVSYPSRRVGPPRLPRRPSARTLVGAAVFGAIVALALLSLRLDAAGPEWGVRLEGSPDGGAVAAVVRGYGVAWAQGVRPGDRVHLVDGADARSFVGRDLGSARRLTTVDAQGRERVVQPPEPPGTVKLALVLAALLFALLGAAVFRWASDPTLGAIFLLFCGATAAALVVIPGALTGSAWANLVAACSSIVAAPALAAVFLWFPRQLRWARSVATLLAVGAVALVVPTATVFTGERVMPPLLDGLLFAWLAASLLGSAGLLAARAMKASERHTLVPILVGVGLGVAPLALLNALPRAFAQPPILRVEVAALATVAIPLVFAYAISRRRLFALDAYLRGLFVRACGGAAMVAISVMAWLVLRGVGLDEELAAVTGLVLAALAAPSVFANVQRALDTWLYPPLRLARSERVTDAETAASIATAVAARVRELVPTAWAACLVRGGEELEGGGSWSAAGSDGDVPAFLQDWLRGGQALPDEAAAGASVVAIDHARGRLGVVVVGPRLDGTPLGGVDVETIRLLTRGAAAPLEAALLRERAEEEARFRQGLGQFARDLAAVGSVEAVLRLTAAYARGLLLADRAKIWVRGAEPGLTELYEPRDGPAAGRARRDLADLLGADLVSHLRQHGIVRGTQPADHQDAGIAGGPLLAFAVDELGLGGALVVMARERWGRLFTATDQRRAVEIADHAGEALRRARMSAQAAEVEALRELDRARTEVVEILAHDLQNPLMAIAGHAYKLQVMAGRLDAAAVAETAGRLLGLAGRTQGLVGDLVTSNGYERGRLALRPEKVDLGQFLAGLVATYRLLPGGDRLRVDAPEGVRAAADPARLEQVVGNLIQNALRYAPTGPIVLGAGHGATGEAWVEVRDLGPGIPPEEQPHVWEKFYRTSEGVRVARAGTGIGLWVVRTLAELHGGRAELESAPGHGSTFRIVLPTAEEGATAVDG